MSNNNVVPLDKTMIEVIMHPNTTSGTIEFKLKSKNGGPIYAGTFVFNGNYLPGVAINLDRKEVKRIRTFLKEVLKPA